jgi:hypothetical protein
MAETAAPADLPRRRDWRQAADYADLSRAGPELLAWEFLRRNPSYRKAAAAAADHAALDWGLIAFADPEHASFRQVFWDRAVNPLVLQAYADPGRKKDPDACDLERLRPHMEILRPLIGPCHILLSDQHSCVQIELRGEVILEGWVRLRWQLLGVTALRPQLMALHRFAAFYRYGRFPKRHIPPVTRLQRLIQALRTYDAATEAVPLVQIANALFGPERVQSDWHGQSDYLRSRIKRLLHQSRRLVDDGYCRLFQAGRQ